MGNGAPPRSTWTEAANVCDSTSRRSRFSAWRALPWDGGGYRQDFADAVSLAYVDEQTANLKVDTFVNYCKPVEPAGVYRPIFEELERKKIKTLIIDTRQNGGGSDDAQLGLLAHLIGGPHTLIASKRVKSIDLTAYADVIKTWDPRALKPDAALFDVEADGWFRLKPSADPMTLQPTEPVAPRFDGRVYALTSRGNASAVTMLLATLREQVGATLVGEATGGSSEGPTAGQIFFLKLPNSGITVRIPWQLQRLKRREAGTAIGRDAGY